MDFKKSGLPQHPLIEKAFNRVHEIINKDFNNPAHAMQQVALRGQALCDGFRDDQPPVRLVCAAFLAFLDQDSSEYGNMRHDYNLEIHQTVERIHAFPDFSGRTEFKRTFLSAPSVHNDIKVSYMANVLAALRMLNRMAAREEFFFKDPDVLDEYGSAITIGCGCLGANAALDYFFEEDVKTYKALRSGTAPGPVAQGPRPALH